MTIPNDGFETNATGQVLGIPASWTTAVVSTGTEMAAFVVGASSMEGPVESFEGEWANTGAELTFVPSSFSTALWGVASETAEDFELEWGLVALSLPGVEESLESFEAWSGTQEVIWEDVSSETGAFTIGGAQILARAQPYVLSNGGTLQLTVNGIVQTVTFSAVDFVNILYATASEVAAVINAQTTALTADVTSNRLRLTTDSTSPSATLVASGGTNLTTFFFGPGDQTADQEDFEQLWSDNQDVLFSFAGGDLSTGSFDPGALSAENFEAVFVPVEVSFNPSANTVLYTAHPLSNGDRVSFTVEADGTLPAPLVEGRLYYVLSAAANTFQLGASSGASTVIDLTDDGNGVITLHRDPELGWVEDLLI